MAERVDARDPRTLITPDAFVLDDDLLGMPLASPRRRLVALLIDLAVIGLITLVTSSFALVLGVVAAVFFIRVGFKRTPVKGNVFGRAMRFSVGCLGLVIGVTTAIIWTAVGFDGFDGEDIPVTTRVEGLEVTGRAGDALGALGATISLARAEDIDEATEGLRALAVTLQATGSSKRQAREAMLEVIPEEASWSDDAPPVVEDILDDLYDAPDGPPEVEPALVAAAERVALLPTRDVLAAYADHLDDPTDEVMGTALRLRLVREVAADTLGRLAAEMEDLAERADELTADLRRANASLEKAEGGGFFNWLRTVVDELGFGFGWASLYLTVMLSWWKGQTIGKKLMGVRVVRLDGEPITWWVAFERAGGYAAGFATGLLGFAQVYWDANRQAIHDRIVGTVVVREGAPRVENWEEAL